MFFLELTLKGIYKSFGAGNVLDGVDFSVKSGEIHALLGENGAGKSTLMNILGGVLRPDSGQILIDGKAVTFRSAADSQKNGIAFIHQSLNMINDYCVYEYIFLPDFIRAGPFLNVRQMVAQTEDLLEKLNISIDPRVKLSSLDMPCKQMVEIARALRMNASLIIMDEPTSSLTEDEIERVFETMNNLRERGVSMIFISHKLREVMSICDRYTVLRNGNMVKTGLISDTTMKELASAMVGRDVDTDQEHKIAQYGDVALQIENLTDGRSFFDVSFSVRQGEILGITGLLGDGRSELISTVFGANGKRYTGRVRAFGKEIHPSSTAQSRKNNMALLPSDRVENGIIRDMSISDNSTLTILDKIRSGLLIDRRKQKLITRKFIDQLKIKVSGDDDSISLLSGGNQQKIVLAKCLAADTKILILDNPTQGIDVGAKEDIYQIIESLAEKGMAIIVLSSTPQEIIRACDRAIVMYHGRVAGVVERENMTNEKLVYLATGAESDGNVSDIVTT